MTQDPTRAQVDAMAGDVVVEFGSATCGYCIAAQPSIAQSVGIRDGVTHLKIEDGRGRPLGRSFGVKLWPTLVLLRNGKELTRVVRPSGVEPLREALAAFD